MKSNEKTPECGGSQTTEVLTKNLNSKVVSHNRDDFSSDSMNLAETKGETDQQTSKFFLNDELKDKIRKSRTPHEAERHCIDFVIAEYNQTHKSGEMVTCDEFDAIAGETLKLCCDAIKFHNDETIGKYWSAPDNLTKAQKGILAAGIPVKSVRNLAKIIEDITTEKIKKFKETNKDLVPVVGDNISDSDKFYRAIDALAEEILYDISKEIAYHNDVAAKGQNWQGLSELDNSQVAEFIKNLYPVKAVVTAESFDEESLLLCVFINDPENRSFGTYSSNRNIFESIIRKLKFTANKKDIDEIMYRLRMSASRVMREDNKDLIALGNGIFDYQTKMLMPFDQEHVFLSKSPINYVHNPVNPKLRYLEDGTDTGEEWDVESWMSSLSDDPEIVNLLWQIVGAIIRPNNRWNRAAWLYSESGNSGKGTLCELMRQICGEGYYASISIADFSKDFLLEALLHASAIIVDENDVGEYVDKAANLKAVITNDVIYINRKYKNAIKYQFRGFSVQCLNEFPRFKDKSESFYRRQLLIPMSKCFTGREKKYIKEEFLHNKQVLEYVLHKVLNTNYYTLATPAACGRILNEYKEFNDPIREFFNEIRTELKWDRVPFEFLYELYTCYEKKNNPSSLLVGLKVFSHSIGNLVRDDDIWTLPNNRMRNFRVKEEQRYIYEPLIRTYDMPHYGDHHFQTDDVRRGYHFFKTDRPYTGIVRRNAADNDLGVEEFQQGGDEDAQGKRRD